MANTLGSGSTDGEAVFFGADAVREGIVIPEEIRIDLPKDFGRDQGIAYEDELWLRDILSEFEFDSDCALMR